MAITKADLKRFQRNADINEIAMMFGRYVTLMDEMDLQTFVDECFALNKKDVSIEYETLGTYIGPDHVKALVEDLQKKLSSDKDKRGWMDIHDGATPYIVISKDGKKAEAMWTLISPKAKQASGEPVFSSTKKLTAFWQCGKMHWKLEKINDEWKIVSFHKLTYFTTEYNKGWVHQQECFRETPLWAVLPDKKTRFYVYHPDQVYVQGGQYNWGPYLPEDGKF